ncbi:ribulose-phosphate 3-epimerase [Caenibacillus caldisaponilyticus]|uniref:ribulose-phosphate 3-epimerase n=1 Tax=Caenibacillus caldisaponilyticus TaxID=1674942 RepID=UPI0009887DAC|nr:ribulose-phosphate 3-epimerase [Caenibacillus caldisaponilyticus]
MIRIVPSILAADFANLADEVKSVERAGVEMIHIDVMDGHFVPNITMGPNVVSALRPRTRCELDVHLMIEDPDRYIPDFVKAGSDRIAVHVEACRHLHRTLQLIKENGARAGVALNPATPVSAIRHVLPDLDFLLIMTVNPGFGGQAFIPQMIEKISEASRLLKEASRLIPIEVDGGINKETIRHCYIAGATEFVAGTAIFNESDRMLAIEELRRL